MEGRSVSHFLIILYFYVLLPLEEGAILALVLQLLYEREGHNDERPEAKVAVKQPAKAEEVGKDEDTAAVPASQESAAETVETAPVESVEPMTEEPAEPEAEPMVEEPAPAEEPEAEPAPQAPPEKVVEEPEDFFQELDAHAQALGVGAAVDEMVHGDSVEMPEDLASRLEEEDVPEAEHFEDDSQDDDDLFPDDEDITSRFEDYGTGFSDFSDGDKGESDDEAEDSDGISPMAVEILGKDFDFDAMLQEAKEEKQAAKNAVPPEDAAEEDSPVTETAEEDEDPEDAGTPEDEAEEDPNAELPEELHGEDAEADSPVTETAEEEKPAVKIAVPQEDTPHEERHGEKGAEEETPEEDEGPDDAVTTETAGAGIFFAQKPSGEKSGEETGPLPILPDRIHEWGEGRFTVDGMPGMDDPLPPEVRTEPQSVAAPFSDEMVENILVEPDRSEEAKRFAFEESSRPMFVRRHRPE